MTDGERTRDQMTALARTTSIRSLNDEFRSTLLGGRINVSLSIVELGPDALNEILGRVRFYADFNSGNDPYGEHDYGSFYWRSVGVVWKINYHPRDLQIGSSDPCDPRATLRVMTIMLADEC